MKKRESIISRSKMMSDRSSKKSVSHIIFISIK